MSEKMWTRSMWLSIEIGRALVTTVINLAEQLLARPEGFTVIRLFS